MEKGGLVLLHAHNAAMGGAEARRLDISPDNYVVAKLSVRALTTAASRRP
jgi:hypothetical protein